ncbi:MAG: hypothetical protein AB1585_19570 [Thermodesulfobacteriota bacterium]
MEVKNTRTIRPMDLRGLRSFKQEYPESKTMLLYRGSDRLVIGNTLCLPCVEFLTALHPERKLEDSLYGLNSL